jgi:hypothetical protein
MSRTVIITLASAAAIAAISFASSPSYAKGFGGGGHVGGGAHIGGGAHVSGGTHAGTGTRMGGGGRSTGGNRTGRDPGHNYGGHPGFPGRNWAFHDRGRWAFRNGVWLPIDAVDAGPAVVDAPVVTAAPAPAPCNCLTKNYTQDGLVVFADICSKEAASAPVDAKSGDASQAPTSTNFAGRNYQDFLAANPQAAAAAKN